MACGSSIKLPHEGVVFLKIKFENLTAAYAPLLKVYYWESSGIDELNCKLKTNNPVLEHTIVLPTRQINSRPLKIVYWIRNYSREHVKLHIKRVQNCNCVPIETRVGFNQFRKIYHCPHRQLIHIRQEYLLLQPEDLVAFSVVSHYFLFGQHKLSYEIHISDSRIIKLHFLMNIIMFDPQMCLLTRELVPVGLKSFDRFVQPIWMVNITMQQLKFKFSSSARGLKLVNPDLTVPSHSIWPLMVKYRPDDIDNTIDLVMNYEGLRMTLPIRSRGGMYIKYRDPEIPLIDYACEDYPYVVYPNCLELTMEMHEERTQMVSIHNFEQKCREFRWQPYLIYDCFYVSFEPQILRIKPHHSTLCVVRVQSFKNPLQFGRTPLVLEVHRILDKSTQIAKQLLEDVESIDDPKWREDSYQQHIYLQLNLTVNFPPDPLCQFDSMISEADESIKYQPITVFEIIYWQYLQQTSVSFLRLDNAHRDDLTSDEVLQFRMNTISKEESKCGEDPPGDEVNVAQCIVIVEEVLAACLRDMAKNWKFIPREYAEQIVAEE